jgi:hypothetical protein
VVVRRVSKKDHTAFVAVGEFEAHDLGPEFGTPVDIAYVEDNVPDLFYPDRGFFFCHKSSFQRTALSSQSCSGIEYSLVPPS